MKALPFHGKYVFCISVKTQCPWLRLSPAKWAPFTHTTVLHAKAERQQTYPRKSQSQIKNFI